MRIASYQSKFVCEQVRKLSIMKCNVLLALLVALAIVGIVFGAPSNAGKPDDSASEGFGVVNVVEETEEDAEDEAEEEIKKSLEGESRDKRSLRRFAGVHDEIHLRLVRNVHEAVKHIAYRVQRYQSGVKQAFMMLN